MAGEELKLVATFEDRISGPMKKVVEQFRSFNSALAKETGRSTRGTKEHASEFKKLSKAVSETAESFRDGFLPGLERASFTTLQTSVGLGALAAVLATAGAAAKGFATSVLEYKHASRETGLSVDEVRQWESLGKFIGVSGDQMRSALGSFNDLVQQMQRRPDLFRQMFATPENAGLAQLRDFMLSVKDLSRGDQLSKIIDFVGQIRDVSQQKKAFEFLRLPPQLADETAENLHRYLDKIKSILTPWTEEQKAMGLDAAVNWIALETQFDDLSNTVGATFVPALNDAIKATNNLIAANKDVIATDLKTWFGEAAKDAKAFYDDLKWVADGLDKITKWENENGEKVQNFWKNFWSAPGRSNPGGPNAEATPIPWGEWFGGSKPPSGGLIQPNAYRPQGSQRAGLQNAAYRVEGGQDLRNPGGAGIGLSSGAADAIEIIAQGTRRGVFDGLTDFAQSSPGGGGGGGLMNASYEGGGIGGSRGGGSGGRWGGSRRGMGSGTNEGPYDPGNIGVPGSLTHLISDAAGAAGIDPRIMEGIRAGESGHGSRYDKKDDALESSWGPFQLNRRRGLGVEFENETGEIRKKMGFGDLRDPRTIPLQAYWVANWIKKHRTTSPWMGFHGLRDADPRWGESGYDPRAIKGDGTGPQSLLESAKKAGALTSPASLHKVAGEASLSVKLANGLVPDGGVKTSGNLFKEVRMDRGGIPYAQTA